MINLLPPEKSVHIRYGRTNATLRRWIIGALIAIAGMLVIFIGGWVYLKSQTVNLQKSLDLTNQQLEKQNLSKVQKDATEISGDIKVINQILSSEVRFSDLIQDLGKVIPPGSVIGSLSLSKINGALDLDVNSKDYASAAQVAVNLNDPANGLFTKVDIISINCSNSSKVYKCSSILKALFSPSAQKKYLSIVGSNSSE